MFRKKLMWFGLFASLPIVLSALVMENSYSQTEAQPQGRKSQTAVGVNLAQADTLSVAKFETQAKQIAQNDLSGYRLSALPKQVEPDAVTAQGGPLAAGDKPSVQELQERAKYWESRGRSDLAARARNQIKQAAPQVSDTSSVKQAEAVNAATGKTGAVISSAAAGAAVEQVKLVLDRKVQTAMPETMVVAATAQPSRQELDERAQYWEARGRSDLADQVRQKLQSLEPRNAGLSRRQGGESLQGQSLVQQGRVDYQDTNRSALEDSLLKNPNSLKTRLDLAQIYRNTGELAKARVQVDSVLLASPDMPDALYASAQLYAEQRLWWETLQTLEKVAPVSRTTDMANLQKMAWAHVQLDRADALVRQGRHAEAEVLLRKVALELSINSAQARLAEPPPLWNATVSTKKHSKKKHGRKKHSESQPK